MASEKYEEGERALREARQVQSAQQARLQLVQQQQEHLRQQEQHMHQARPRPALAPPALPTPHPGRPPSQRALFGDGAQEHLSLAQQRLQLDRVRQDLSSSPMGLLTKAQGLPASGLSGKWLQKDGTLAAGWMCAGGGSRLHPPAVVRRPWGDRLWPSCPPSDTSVPDLPLGLCSHRGSCSCSPSAQPAAGRPGPLAPPRQAGAAETHS